jgi:hypothetical protein
VAIIERFCEVLTETESSYVEWKRLLVAHDITGVSVHDARLVSVLYDRGITHLLTLDPADFARYPRIAAVPPAAI